MACLALCEGAAQMGPASAFQGLSFLEETDVVGT